MATFARSLRPSPRWDRDLHFLGEVFERAERRAHVSVTITVDCSDPEIGRDRIDQDRDHVSDFDNLSPQFFQIADQAEHTFALLAGFLVTVADHVDEMNAAQIGAGSFQARHQAVVETLLGGKDDHVARRANPFAVWPFQTASAARGDVAKDLSFTLVR